MPRYDEVVRAQALALSESLPLREVAQRLGIPEGTIKRWRFELRTERGEPARTNRTEKVRELTAAAQERAIEEAASFLAERLKRLSEDLYALAAQAVAKVRVAIADPEELPPGKTAESHDRDGAAWVRALVGVMSQAIEKAQLLAERPTQRTEDVKRREEYVRITYELAADTELLRAIQQAADRRTASRDPGRATRPVADGDHGGAALA